MAKKLYEEENIRAIADKIRQFSWNKTTTYTVKQMANGVEGACQNQYESGFDYGHRIGEGEGHDIGWQEGYDEGHTDGWNEGFDEGVAQGGGELHHLLLEQIQSQEVVYMSKYQFCYPVNIYGKSIDYDMTFDDYVDREYSSLSSNPLTYSVDNYTDFYLYLYIRATDTANDEGMLAEIVVPPNCNNSTDFVSQVGMGNPVEWKIEIIGARFAVDEI